jgi:hypothetical protein
MNGLKTIGWGLIVNIINSENVVLSGSGNIDGSGRTFRKSFKDED